MKKMSKQDVETVIFENAKTGEALEFQHEQHKAEYGAKHFWKADKKFFELLSTFSAAESKVVAYILQKTQPTKNEFIGAYKTIARKLGCDVTTVRNTFKKMMENDMLAKTDDERIWMLNPRLLVKGDIIVKARLMSKYDSLLGRPLSDWIITDSNGNDPLFLPIEYPTPESLDTAKSDFIKVYHLFFETLSGLGGKESEVLNFLVCAIHVARRLTCQDPTRRLQRKNCRRRWMRQEHCRASVSNRSGKRQLRSGVNIAHSNAAWRCRFRSISQLSWIVAGKTRIERTTAASVPRCCGHGHYRYRAG